MTTTVPLWVSVVVAVGTPALAFAGVMLGQLLTRRSAREIEVRWQREEAMRLLLWAADNASSDGRSRAVGIATLRALGRSPLLRADDLDLVGAVLSEVYRQRRRSV